MASQRPIVESKQTNTPEEEARGGVSTAVCPPRGGMGDCPVTGGMQMSACENALMLAIIYSLQKTEDINDVQRSYQTKEEGEQPHVNLEAMAHVVRMLPKACSCATCSEENKKKVGRFFDLVVQTAIDDANVVDPYFVDASGELYFD